MPLAIALFQNSTALGSWRAPHQLMMVHADGLFGAPRDLDAAATAFWRFMELTSGWKDNGRAAAKQAAEGNMLGSAARYALMAEQGCPSAVLNLAWLNHRGTPYRGADRHRLALGLWERGVVRGRTEAMLMAGHLLLHGAHYGLEGGEWSAGGGKLSIAALRRMRSHRACPALSSGPPHPTHSHKCLPV